MTQMLRIEITGIHHFTPHPNTVNQTKTVLRQSVMTVRSTCLKSTPTISLMSAYDVNVQSVDQVGHLVT